MLKEVVLEEVVNREISIGAGFGIRAVARIIDLLYCYGVIFVTGLFLGLLQLIMGRNIIGDGEGILATIFSILAMSMYNTICESYHGASLGKLICGLRVLDENGNRCSFISALIRNLVYVFDGLFFGLVGYMAMSKTPLNQRHGDRIGKTIVVKKEQVPEKSRRSGFDFFVALIVGSGANSIIASLGALLDF